jgi:hypothetical protein
MNFNTQIAMRRGGVGASSGALGAELYNEPGANPPVAPVDTAWNFTTSPCTYTMQSGDTLDGIAQTYMNAPAGDWVPPGSPGYPRAINRINLLNLDNPFIASGHQEKLQVGTVLKMPADACANAPGVLKAYCLKTWGPKTVFRDGRCMICTPNSSPDSNRTLCFCDPGFVLSAQGTCIPDPGPPPPDKPDCPTNTHWDGTTCVPDGAVTPTPAAKKAVSQAGIFSSPWLWGTAALGTIGFIAFSEKDRKKRLKKKPRRRGRR